MERSKELFVIVWARLVHVTLAQHINFGHSHFPKNILPKSPTWDPQNKFPGIPWSRVFLWKFYRTLNIPNFLANPGFELWAFWGFSGNQVDMLGNSE